MNKLIIASILLSACDASSSKLDEPTKKECGTKNKAARLLQSEDKKADCEEYYCDEGQTHYYAVKCESSDKRRVWVSVDTLQGPLIKWMQTADEAQAAQAEAKAQSAAAKESATDESKPAKQPQKK